MFQQTLQNGGRILLFIHKNTPAKFISAEKPPIESFFTKLNLRKKKSIVICSYNSHKNNRSSHLEASRQSMDIHSFNYDSFTFLGNFNAGVGDKAMLDFRKSYNLKI